MLYFSKNVIFMFFTKRALFFGYYKNFPVQLVRACSVIFDVV